MKQPLHLNRTPAPSGSGTRPGPSQRSSPKLPPTSEHDQRQREESEGEEQGGAHGSNYGGLRRPPEPEDGPDRSPF